MDAYPRNLSFPNESIQVSPLSGRFGSLLLQGGSILCHERGQFFFRLIIESDYFESIELQPNH